MFTNVKLANMPARVKPESVWQRGNQLRRVDSLPHAVAAEDDTGETIGNLAIHRAFALAGGF
jgi:hypothetical protein